MERPALCGRISLFDGRGRVFWSVGQGAWRAGLGFRQPSIGLTIVAFGTSLPEFLVSLVANLQGNGAGAIAIGNIVGSNIANLALVLGTAAILTVIPVDQHIRRREFPLLVAVTLVFAGLAYVGSIGRVAGLILFTGLIGFTYYSYTTSHFMEADEAEDVPEAMSFGLGRLSTHWAWHLSLVVAGIIMLIGGAQLLVGSAQELAYAIGISELIVGLTLVAIGTSLPELATTVVAISRNESDLAVGNVIGSNLFNMLFIGGVSSIIKPLTIPPHMLAADIPVMVGITILAGLLMLPRPFALTRWNGVLLLSCYLGYIVWLFV